MTGTGIFVTEEELKHVQTAQSVSEYSCLMGRRWVIQL